MGINKEGNGADLLWGGSDGVGVGFFQCINNNGHSRKNDGVKKS